jgi:hypothetical protein
MSKKFTGYLDCCGVKIYEGMETNHGIITFGTDDRWRLLNNLPVPDMAGELQGVVGVDCFLDDVLDSIKVKP